jgi:hypothetical protein
MNYFFMSYFLKFAWIIHTNIKIIILFCCIFSSFILILGGMIQLPVLSRQTVCLPSFSPLCHVSSYAFWFSVSFRSDFSCVLFLWIMLHLINHIYCILCWDSPFSPLWVWFVGSLWDLAMSLHINYYINLLTPWLVGFWLILSYCFPYVILLKHGMRQADTHTHTLTQRYRLHV